MGLKKRRDFFDLLGPPDGLSGSIEKMTIQGRKKE